MFQEELQSIIRNSAYTQQELAIRAGIDRQTISELLRDNARHCNWPTALAIAFAAGLPTSRICHLHLLWERARPSSRRKAAFPPAKTPPRKIDVR